MAVILLYGCCCDGGKKSYSRYQILNNSDYSIKLYVFNSLEEPARLVDSISLNNKGDIWESEKFATSGSDDHFSPPGYYLKGDSVVVELDRKRRLIHEEVYGSNESILNDESYELIGEDENYTLRRYTFTNEDYNNGEEIGG